MKILGSALAALAFASFPVSGAQANPMDEVCHVRAAKNSGYSGTRSGLTKKVGNTTFRLSGSVAVGTSRSSGPAGGYRAPAFAGAADVERREAKEKSKIGRAHV